MPKTLTNEADAIASCISRNMRDGCKDGALDSWKYIEAEGGFIVSRDPREVSAAFEAAINQFAWR